MVYITIDSITEHAVRFAAAQPYLLLLPRLSGGMSDNCARHNLLLHSILGDLRIVLILPICRGPFPHPSPGSHWLVVNELPSYPSFLKD